MKALIQVTIWLGTPLVAMVTAFCAIAVIGQVIGIDIVGNAHPAIQQVVYMVAG